MCAPRPPSAGGVRLGSRRKRRLGLTLGAACMQEHWDTASLLPLEMVTPGNLKYDVRDWEETVRTGVFGCKAKPEAVKR